MESHAAQSTNDRQRLVETWSETLRQEIAAYKRARDWRIARWILIPLFFVILWAVFHIKIGFWWFWLFFGANAAVDANAASRRDLATSLTRSRDPRVVSILAIAACDGDEATRKVAISGLVDILPTLKASDRVHVTDEGMGALLALLRLPKPQLVVAVLEALKQIGDSRSLRIVEELAFETIAHGSPLVQGRYPYSQSTLDEINAAARDALPFIRARIEEEAARTTLLRPTSSGQETESLLRPAASQEADEQFLLRPTSGASDAG